MPDFTPVTPPYCTFEDPCSSFVASMRVAMRRWVVSIPSRIQPQPMHFPENSDPKGSLNQTHSVKSISYIRIRNSFIFTVFTIQEP